MKIFIKTLLLIVPHLLFSQAETHFLIDLTANNSSNVLGKKGFSTLKSGIACGILLDFNTISTVVAFSYQHENNFEFEKYGYVSPNFTFKNNLLGVSNNILLLSSKSRFRPLIKINLLTEVKSNYRNGFLWDNDRQNLITLENYNITPSGQEIYSLNPISYYYTSNFYYSTPFIVSLLAGCDIHLIENLHFNIELGYGLRVLKTQNLQWTDGENISHKLKDAPINIHLFHMLDAQIGLSYSFPLKKKTKTP